MAPAPSGDVAGAELIVPKRLPRARTRRGEPKIAHYGSGGGAPGGPPILLLHQSLARSEDWENIFPRLATRYRAIAYDARGHGKSGRAPDYSLRAFADDALRILREIAKEPSVLIGHSLGALAALVAAGDEPAAALITDAIGKVRAPVLVLAGEPRLGGAVDDPAEWRLKKLADVTVKRFPGSGHLLHGFRPEQFIENIEPFLRKLREA